MSKLLEEGDVIEIKEGHRIYAYIPKHFVYSNRKGDFSLCHHDVRIGEPFEYLAGRYVVIKTSEEGGGTRHGPHDVYPDGHRVYCVKADDENVKIDFYQTGCFTAMIPDIEPIGKATLKWVMED